MCSCWKLTTDQIVDIFGKRENEKHTDFQCLWQPDFWIKRNLVKPEGRSVDIIELLVVLRTDHC